MSRVSISDLARIIAKKHKLTIRESEKFITAFIDVVNNGLRYDKQVKIKGLGTFKVIDTKNRKSVNINTGETIIIEGRSKITFTPDTVMRDIINKPFSQFETVPVNDGVEFDDIETLDNLAVSQLDDESDDNTNGQEVQSSMLNVQSPEEEVLPAVEEPVEPVSQVVPLAELNGLDVEEPSQEMEEPSEPEETSSPSIEAVEPEQEDETDLDSTEESAPVDEATTPPAGNEEPVTEEVAEEEHQELLAEETEEPVEEESKESLEVEPIEEEQPSRVNPNIFEDQKASLLQRYRDYSEELEYELDRQRGRRKWWALLSLVLIACAGVGGYYAGRQITTEQLQERYQALLVDSISEDSISRMIADEARADSADKAAKLAKLRADYDLRRKAMKQSDKTANEFNVARERAEEMSNIQADKEKAERERYEAELRAKAEARQAKQKAQEDAQKKAAAEAEAKKQAAAQAAAKTAKQSAPSTLHPTPNTQHPAPSKPIPVSSSKYDEMSAAVRLGAYRIVGIDQTITVRKGQTLKSISKAYFGPGMECYVEALNGGIKEVTEGQKLKIPKLELKKKKQ